MQKSIIKQLTFGILLVFAVSLARPIHGQDYLPVSRQVELVQNDSLLRFRVQVKREKIRLNNREAYTWYFRDRLGTTFGGFSGDLLHGSYEVFGRQRALVLSGSYENGQRNGSWKAWYSNGVLKYVENWKNGRLHGKRTVYAMDGKFLKEETYCNGIRNGRERTAENGKITVRYYRNGKEKERNGFSLFKRKTEKQKKSKKEEKQKKKKRDIPTEDE